jgi:colanic acid/amylovoran biosynthesis glycosyltransferase
VKICITRSEAHSYSETFIRDQIAGFAKLAQVCTVHSGRLPERKEDGTLLAPWLFWVLHKIIKSITGKRNNYFGNYGLKKYLREQQVDVVLANYGISGAHFVPICRDLHIPLLVIFHGHDATDKKLLKEYTNKYKALFSYASAIIVVSQDMRERIVKLGADASKVKVVSCGVDVNKFSLSSASKEKLFLAVGRFVNKKGPLFTIKAFHEVWKKDADAKLIMVGAHRGLYEACVALTNSLDMQNSISFPGILNQDQIKELMAKALAYVQHSVVAPNGDMEGTPVSILEAAASGLPVISTVHGGIPDAIVHNKTGLLVNEGDVTSMTVYMLQLLDAPAQAAAMGKEGRAHIIEHYDQTKQIEKLHALAMVAVVNNRR